ncbi:MAG: hypothetical protein B6245_01795 [Desulfobacteraceae bacterium 4572_88]|nr:MAG: hypothetical protein B6245_01795 [Desulfobacteraceae bacterium 4572_88]
MSEIFYEHITDCQINHENHACPHNSRKITVLAACPCNPIPCNSPLRRSYSFYMDFSVIVQEKDSDVMVKILPDLRTWAVQTQGS